MIDDLKWWIQDKWKDTPTKYKIVGAIILVAIIGSFL
jgi:hypothetical protein